MSGRIRTIKPEILEDEKTASLDDHAWRLFVGMFVIADDYGNMRGTPEWLHSQIFWKYPEDVEKTREGLATLSRESLVALYDVSEQCYASITNWVRHQRVDKPGKPRVPRPENALSRDSREDPTRVSRLIPIPIPIPIPIADAELVRGHVANIIPKEKSPDIQKPTRKKQQRPLQQPTPIPPPPCQDVPQPQRPLAEAYLVNPPGAFCPCPPDLHLLPSQYTIAEIQGISRPAVDVITAIYVSSYAGKPNETRTLQQWLSGLSKAVHQDGRRETIRLKAEQQDAEPEYVTTPKPKLDGVDCPDEVLEKLRLADLL